MKRIRLPLRDQLEDPVDEAALQRIARGIEARLGGASSSSMRRNRRLLPVLLAAVLATLGAIIAIGRFVHFDAGPLLLADGGEFVAVSAAGSAREIRLSDGSSIRLSAGAQIGPLESSGTTFSAILTQGSAEFDVRPGGPRHWVIECGLATVEVVGTAFTCQREPGRLRVAVQRGVVLVRGERVPHRARRLAASEILDVTEGAAPAPSALGRGAASEEVASPAAAVSGADSERVKANANENENAGAPAARAKTVGSWRELARSGRHREAFAALGTEGVRRESAKLGAGDLLALADVARLSGHPEDAVAPLQRILDEFSRDAQAPLAAFALGRLELDSLGHAPAAVSAFRKALALGVPRSLREDVRARLVEAYARASDTAGAERAADAYLDEFPNGRHLRAIQGWLRRR